MSRAFEATMGLVRMGRIGVDEIEAVHRRLIALIESEESRQPNPTITEIKGTVDNGTAFVNICFDDGSVDQWTVAEKQLKLAMKCASTLIGKRRESEEFTDWLVAFD